jgi:hypothetical protein
VTHHQKVGRGGSNAEATRTGPRKRAAQRADDAPKSARFELPNGRVEWRMDGVIHRVDGPAVELDTGYRAWYQNGVPHRLDGPAIENADGSREWLIDGAHHREDGPALIDAQGREFWYKHGEYVGGSGVRS